MGITSLQFDSNPVTSSLDKAELLNRGVARKIF